MAKLTGRKKEEFLARMAAGRAAASGGKKPKGKSSGKASGKASAGPKKSAGKLGAKGTKYVVRARARGAGGSGEIRSRHRKAKPAREAAARLQKQLGHGWEVFVDNRAGKAAGKPKGAGKAMVTGRSIKPRGAGKIGGGSTGQRLDRVEAAVTILARNDQVIAEKVHEIDGRLNKVEGVMGRWLKGRG